MLDKLIISPSRLYDIYNYKQLDIHYNYNYNFLSEFKSIDIYIFYDILNCLSLKQLKSLDRYIYKQLSLINLVIDKSDKELDIESIKREKKVVKNIYSHKLINSPEELNNKLKKYINKDKILSLVIMNKLLIFLYPC